MATRFNIIYDGNTVPVESNRATITCIGKTMTDNIVIELVETIEDENTEPEEE